MYQFKVSKIISTTLTMIHNLGL
jgi:hypothetical protein